MARSSKVSWSSQCHFIFVIFGLNLVFCTSKQNCSVEIACIQCTSQATNGLNKNDTSLCNRLTGNTTCHTSFKDFHQYFFNLKTTHNFNKNTNDSFIWMPFERKLKYGPYESTKWGKNYGKILNKDNMITVTEEIFEKNCLVFDIQRKVINPEYCTKAATNIYCIKTSCDNCTDTRNILQYYFKTNNLACLVKCDNTCVWRKLKTNLSRPKKSISYRSTVEMVLTFKKESKKLLLIIYSPEQLYKKGEEKFIYCFTNASKKLKERVRIEKIFQYVNKSNEAEKMFIVYKIKLENFMGHYWCEAYKNDDLMITSNKLIAYKKKEGNEYALRIVIDHVCESFDCGKDTVAVPYEKFLDNNVLHVLKELNAEVRVMEIFYYDYKELDFLLHITTRKNKNVTTEFNELHYILKSNSNDIKILYFKNSEYCLPESTKSGGKYLHWPLTNIGTNSTSQDMCLGTDDLPIVRECGGDFLYGADWLQVIGNCHKDLNSSEVTNSLYVLTNNISLSTLKNVTNILHNGKEISVLNLYYTTIILESVYETLGSNLQVVSDSLNLVDSLLSKKSDNFSKAQHLLNINDNMLDVTEDILTHFSYEADVYLFQKDHIIVHIAKPFTSNVSGIVLFSNNTNVVVKDYVRNSTISDIVNEKFFKLGVYLPEQILDDIYTKNLTDIHIVTTVMFTDYFFVNGEKKPVGPIVSVTVPDYGSFLPSSLPVFFNSELSENYLECGYWDYGISGDGKKIGSWSQTGGNYLGTFSNSNSIHVCTFSHLTHFALLILEENSYLVSDFNAVDDYLLNIISLIGSTLTMIGIFGIFLTAILFEKWRKRQGTKILINLSIAIFLETIMVHVIEFKDFITTSLDCRIVGTITHYAVISKFFWMLVYAFLQYVRFVKVLGAFPERIMLKSAIFGWGFAVIPVLAVNVFTPYSYSLKDYHFCYPKGMSLYVGVLLPVITIIMVNLTVFCIVMHQVSAKKFKSQCTSTSSYTLQLKLATLLFFVLGIPWLFGVLANLITNPFLKSMLVYLFCMTATVQGFVLFLFYVVLNRETRMYWSQSILNTLKITVVTNSTT